MNIGHAQAGPAPSRQAPAQDRRRSPDTARPALGWLRALIRRPFRVQWRGRLPQLAWVERRHASAPDLATQRLRADLRTELLALGDEEALALQELLRVEEQLGRAGWAGIAALPVQALARATVQAERLAAATESPALAGLVTGLRALQPAAGASAASADAAAMAAPPDIAGADSIEVSELGEDAYAQAEQIWASSQPAALPMPPKGGDVRA